MASPVAARAPRRTLLAGAAVAALGIGGLAVGAGDASAAFTIGECQGSSTVVGQGASFQAELHRSFSTVFAGTLNGCGGSPAAPRFVANGSGSGLMSAGAGGTTRTLNCDGRSCTAPLAAGARDLSVSFQATDDPPTVEQYANMQAGDRGTAADDALLHVVPLATGAAVMVVRLPPGCSIKADGATTLTGTASGDSFANGTQRPLISNRTIELAWAGATGGKTWGDLVPTISGVESSSQIPGDVDCEDVQVRRIVRTDNSGTTYSWKAYLSLTNGTRGWTDRYAGNPNTSWPVDGSGSATPTAINTASAEVCPYGGANLCSNTGTGGGALADAVNLVDGSIGYVDLATARSKSFWNGSTASTQDLTFWLPLEVRPEGGASGVWAEPTIEPSAHNSANVNKGASCGDVRVQFAPTPAGSPNGDPTLGDWSKAFAAGGPGYPACVLTYGLLWDDNAVVYGTDGDQQERARTVKDYFTKLVSNGGQGTLLAADYSSVPQPLLSYAQAGVAAIDWNKSAGGGGGGNREPETRQPETRQPETRQPETRTPPSNAFSIPSGRATASLITYVVQLPGAGSLKVTATAKVGKKTIKVSTLSAKPSKAGRFTLRLKLSAAAKQALKKAKGKKLAVTVKFTYTPTGGTAKSQSKKITVKAAKARAKKKAAKR